MRETSEKAVQALSDLAVWLAWVTVMGLPIGAALGVRHWWPEAGRAVPWIVGGMVFAVCICLVEWICRWLTWLLTAGRSERLSEQ